MFCKAVTQGDDRKSHQFMLGKNLIQNTKGFRATVGRQKESSKSFDPDLFCVKEPTVV